MKIARAIVLYVLIALTFMQNWWLLAVALIFVFSIYYNTSALIPLAILLDGYFGNFHSLPLLSFVSIIWFVVVEYLRPKIINLSTA